MCGAKDWVAEKFFYTDVVVNLFLWVWENGKRERGKLVIEATRTMNNEGNNEEKL